MFFKIYFILSWPIFRRFFTVPELWTRNDVVGTNPDPDPTFQVVPDPDPTL
jgi:hypothetical protein